MADHSARIAEIEDLLRSGVKQVTANGETVAYDLPSLRAELAKLKADDDDTVAAGYRRRPKLAGFRLP